MATIGGGSIGNTRPSAQPLAAPSPRPVRGAFGEGVAAALSDLSESFADLEDSRALLNRAEKERREKLDRFKSLTALSAWEEGSKRLTQDIFTAAPADGSGVTNSVHENVEASRKKFLESVPQELRPEFDFRSSVIRDSLTTSAYSTEFKLSNAFYKSTIEQSLTDARVAIFNDPNQFDDKRLHVLGLIEQSNLSELEKQELRETAERGMEAALAKKEFTISRLPGRGTVGPADGKDVVAAGLPAFARGFLNAVAETESPGYNVLNGGATFEGYEQHPAERGIKGKESTAAGRYQFTIATWLEAAAAIGATDFSPEWQDRAAWWLAQKRYAQATGGEDLLTTLMSGNREVIKQIPEALGSTWAGLVGNKMTPDKFANFVLGSRGAAGGPTGPAQGPRLYDDPRFQHLTLDDMIALTADGELEADKLRSEQIAAEERDYEAWKTDFEFDVFNGDKGLSDIHAANADGLFRNVGDVERAIKIYKDRNEGIEDLVHATTKLQNNGLFVWTDDADRKGLNALIKADKGTERLTNLDKDYVEQGVVPLVRHVKDIPTDVVGTVEALSRRADANSLIYAFETMRQLEEAAPDAFRNRFSESAERNYELFQGMRAADYPIEDIVQRVKGFREHPQDLERLQVEADKHLKEIDFTTVADAMDTSFVSLGDPSLPPRPLDRAMFEREFIDQYRTAYTITEDADIAEKTAIKVMQRTWAPTSIGGRTYVMKHPPERSWYPTVGQSYNWIEEQLIHDVPELKDAQFYQLVADDQTRNDIERYRRAQEKGSSIDLPSYLLFKMTDEGKFVPVMREDNTPARWRGDPQPFVERAVSETSMNNMRLRHFELRQRVETLTPAEREEFDNLVKILRVPEPKPRPRRSPPEGAAGAFIFGGN